METINATGRRKSAVARIHVMEGQGEILVNGQDFKSYFPTTILQSKVLEPFEATGTTGKFKINVNLGGGGVTGQAEALTLAISRALIKISDEHRSALKSKGLLRRDPRMVERKKYGQKKARKRFQFSKR
jgi:small subunit ribosomal protein S9